MGITKSKGHKESLDKFYTSPAVAKSCIELLDLTSYDVVVEPSAGSGSFSKQIPNCDAYDLKPESNDIIQQDFFKLDTWKYHNKKVLTIGNPPFGIQNNLAVGFFNKAAEFSDTIAFILPKTFMKISVQNKLDLNFHLETCVDIPKNSFLLNGETYDVPCVFQIWRKLPYERTVEKCIGYSNIIEFTNEDYDFVIHRVGGNTGKAFIPKFGEEVSRQSNYFVKNISLYTNETLIDMINEIDMKCSDWSVGPKSISKPELIHYIEEAERQKSGFDFEIVVEKIFKNVVRNTTNYTSEFDAILKFNGEKIPCSIKHSENSLKKDIELADLNRNVNNKHDYILFNGVDDSIVPDKIHIHFKDRVITIDNNLQCKVKDIYVYHIIPEKLGIDYEIMDECDDLEFTRCLNIDKGMCDFSDSNIFKHNNDTSVKTRMVVYVKKDVLSRDHYFEEICDRKYLNDKLGFVVYEPIEGFITHIPVDDSKKPYVSIDDVPDYYDAILKIDNTNLTDDNWNIVRSMIEKRFNGNNVLKIRPKRDHKKQFRFQCAVDKTVIKDDLYEYDENMFAFNERLKNIKSYDEFIKEPALWESYD